MLFAVFSAFGAFASSASSLILWRGAMGIGAALVFPATLAIITNLFVDPVERAKAIGLWSPVSGMAVAFGPVAGGFLLEHFWWGSVFLVNIPIVAVALVLGHYLVPESREPHRGRFDLVGLVLSVVGVGALVFTVIESPHWGWGASRARPASLWQPSPWPHSSGTNRSGPTHCSTSLSSETHASVLRPDPSAWHS